jgi:hypothetical protein
MRSLSAFWTGLLLVLLTPAMRAQVACPISSPSLTWSNQTVMGLGISSFSGLVRVTGSLTVDADLTFDGAEVGLDPTAVIHVQSGYRLRIVNGSILTNLQTAWTGIELEPGAILEVADSEICGALTAISADNAWSATAASIEVRDSGLRFNGTGLSVRRFAAGPYPALVVGTHFEGGAVPTLIPSTSYAGVYAFQVFGGDGLVIGGPAPAFGPNRFTDMELGIEARGSSLQAFQNVFERIQPATDPTTGVAIRALNNPSGGQVLAVGTGADRTNTMTDCRVGVQADGLREVIVSDNTMGAPAGPFERGVELYRTREVVIVAENDIRQFTDLGVLLDDHPGVPSTMMDASINDNVLEGSLGTSQGILVDEYVGGLAIRFNPSITQVHRGITVQNAAPAAGTAISVDNNTVGFSYPGPGVTSDPAVGILAVSVFQPTIDNNVISGNCDFPFGGVCTTGTPNNARIRGIQLVFTELAQVFKNTVSDCGGGLFVLQANNEGNAICNHFDNCFSGVVWSNMGADEFGFTIAGSNRVYGLITPTTSSDNRWTSPVPGLEPIRSYAINGSPAGTIDWFFRSAPTYDFPLGTNLDDPGPSSSLAVAAGDPSTICDLLPYTGGGGGESSAPLGFEALNDDRTARFQAMAGQPIESVDGRDYTFLQGAWLAGSTQPLVQGLVARTNIPVLDPRRRTLTRLEADSVPSWLSSLTPVNREEELMLELLGMRHALASDSARDAWTTAQRARLREVSRLSLEEAGRAAFYASSLLNVAWIPDDWGEEAPSGRLAADALPNPLRVQPNPASDRFRINVEAPMTGLRILDATGKVVWAAPGAVSGALEVEAGSWPVGVYWVVAGTSESGRVVLPITIQR